MKIRSNNRKRHSINRVMNYMRSHLDSPLCLDRLADVACLSKYHFIGVFNHYCLETPFEFLSRTRLEYAIDNLVYKPDHSITDVALNCGFSNPQAFSRAFKQRYSLSPRSYRMANDWRFDRLPENQMEIEFKNQNLKLLTRNLSQDHVTLEHISKTQLAYIRHVGLTSESRYQTHIHAT